VLVKAIDLLVDAQCLAARELVGGRKYQIAEFIKALRDSGARILSADR
jgi:hypothetical protein